MLTPKDIAIAEARMKGLSMQEIAQQEGCHHSTISRHLSKPELKAYIEQLHSDLIASSLHHAVSNIHHAVSSYQKAGTNPQLKEHGHKLNVKLAESVGILPAQAQTILINNIYNDNRTEVPEIIKQLFAAITHRDQSKGLLGDPDVVDIDPGDDKAKRGAK